MSENLPFNSINEFSLERLLHESPFTMVYRGYQTNLKRHVLIKLLKPAGSDELKKRFEREARVYARLSHPNIVAVHALGEKDKYLYIIQEYVEGSDLRTLLQDSGFLETPLIWHIIDGVLAALEHAAEQNVVHRDIKPENILIDRQGRIKVADFGLALITDEPALTVQQSLVGTPAYMSPEQITAEKLTIQSDLFSLAAVLYELVFREQAFAGAGYAESINKILNDEPQYLTDPPEKIDAALFSFLKRGLQKQISQRWPSVHAARDEWHALKPAEPESAQKRLAQKISAKDHKPHRHLQSGVPGKDKRKSFFLIYIVFFALLLFSVFWFLGRDFSEKRPIRPPLPVDSLNKPAKDSVVLKDYTMQQADTIARQITALPEEKDLQGKQKSERKENLTAHIKEEKPATPAKIILAELDLRVTPWARVYINQTLVDTHVVDRHFSLPPGPYNLRFEHPRFPAENQQVNLAAGELTQVLWSFWDKTGFLKLAVRPWAHVYINDEFYDTTPLAGPLRIPAGNKVLELRHPELKNHRERIIISAGDTLSLKIALQP